MFDLELPNFVCRGKKCVRGSKNSHRSWAPTAGRWIRICQMPSDRFLQSFWHDQPPNIVSETASFLMFYCG